MVHQCGIKEQQTQLQMICKSLLSIPGFAIHTLTDPALLTVWKMKRLHLDKETEQ